MRHNRNNEGLDCNLKEVSEVVEAYGADEIRHPSS